MAEGRKEWIVLKDAWEKVCHRAETIKQDDDTLNLTLLQNYVKMQL